MDPVEFVSARMAEDDAWIDRHCPRLRSESAQAVAASEREAWHEAGMRGAPYLGNISRAEDLLRVITAVRVLMAEYPDRRTAEICAGLWSWHQDYDAGRATAPSPRSGR